MSYTTRAAVLAVLVALSALTGATAIVGADATPTTHEVRDHHLSMTGDATVAWTATGAELHVNDTDGTLGDEARLTVDAADVGLSTLGDLETLSWTVNGGVGYAPHADVYLDTNGSGTADEALVFEYYKVGEPCDGGTPPTGDYDTFGDKGIVDANATAWLATGAPGPCGDPAFVNGTLAEWQAGSVDPSVDANTTITHIEIEVDNWIENPSSATVSAVTVNDETYHGQIDHAMDAAEAGDTISVEFDGYAEDFEMRVETVTNTVTNTVHEHHHHSGGTRIVERTVTVEQPSPTPRVETVVEERTVEVPGPERTVVRTEVVERTVIREVTQTPGQPGFGMAVAIVALLAAGMLALRRRD